MSIIQIEVMVKDKGVHLLWHIYIFILLHTNGGIFCLNDWFYIQFSIQVLTSIAYCLHFVDVIVINDVVKCGVELVEEIYNLVRSTGTRQLSEANDVAVIE